MGAVENPAARHEKLNDSDLQWNQAVEDIAERGACMFPTDNAEDEEDEDTLVSSGTETDTEQPHVIEDKRPNHSSPRKPSATKAQTVFSSDSEDSEESDLSYNTSYSSSSDPSSGSNSSDDALSDSSDSSSSCVCSDSSSDSLSCDSSSESESEGTKAPVKGQTKSRGAVKNNVVSLFGIMGYGGIWRHSRLKESSGRRRIASGNATRDAKSPSTLRHSLPSAKSRRVGETMKNDSRERKGNTSYKEEENEGVGEVKTDSDITSGTTEERTSQSLVVFHSDRQPLLDLDSSSRSLADVSEASSSVQISPRIQEVPL